MKRLISKAEFAKLCNVSQAAVVQAIKRGTDLANAVVGEGRKQRIDLDHPDAQEYANSKAENMESYESKKPKKNVGAFTKKESKKKKVNNAPEIHEVPDDITELGELSLNEIVSRYGTDYQFLDWLRSLKEVELINDRRVKTEKLKGELISKTLVHKAFIAPVDACFRQMLSDGAKNIAKRVRTMVEAGNNDDTQLEKFVSDTMSSFIKQTKNKIKRSLDNLEDD